MATTNGEHAPPIPPKPVQRSVSFTETDNLARKRSNSEVRIYFLLLTLSQPSFNTSIRLIYVNLYGLFIFGVNIKHVVLSILYSRINLPMAFKELTGRPI